MNKRKRLMGITVIAVMILTAIPDISFAKVNKDEENIGENQILVVYDKDAACTEKLQNTDFAEGEDTQSRTVEKLADSSTQQLADNADISAESGEFVTGNVASQGAMLKVQLDSDESVDKAIDSIEKQPDVAYAQPNFAYELMGGEVETLKTTNDTALSSQYYLNSWSGNEKRRGANVTSAWDYVKSEGKATVAVIDTGIDTKHPDLVDNLDLKHSKAITGQLYDEDGHGTHVAGIVGAVADNGAGIAGVSYNAKIIAINVFERNDKGEWLSSTDYMIKALSYIEELVSTGKVKNLHVINISSGQYAYDQSLEESIKRMRDKYNIVTVCAGGNKGIQKNLYPADYNASVAVTALDENGTNAEYSDYNRSKDISAPGTNIISTYPGNNYARMSGTSMAAPVVSGAMAMLWAGDPDITVDQAIRSIKRTANPVNRSANDRGNLTGSVGAVDCEKAYRYAMGTYDGVLLPEEIADYNISLGYKTCTYSGAAKRPAVKIGDLTEGKDFKVSYSSNVKVGTGTVTIIGMGDYTGTVKKTFKINPKGTNIRKTSRVKRGLKVFWKKQTTQTDGYQIQYSRYSSFKNSSSKYSSKKYSSKKLKKLKSKKNYYVRVRTYKKVNGTTYYSSWSKSKRVKIK